MSKVQQGKGFKWMLISAAVLLLPGLLALGFWQLHRAEVKSQLLSSWQSQTVLDGLPLEMDLSRRDYLGIRLKVKFDRERYLLLDNRLREGRVGYELVATATTEDKRNLLVNLGWLPSGTDRRNLPQVNLPSGWQVIEGHIRHITPSFVLADTPTTLGWPKLVQSLDLNKLATVLPAGIEPYELRIKHPVLPGVSTRWPVSHLLPERHLGYAVQWFAMAGALAVLLVWSWRFLSKEQKYE